MSANPVAHEWPKFSLEAQVVASDPEVERDWVLRRNCSLTPVQMAVFYASLCAVALVLSAGFWWQGAPLVSFFAGAEVLAVGAALLIHARHIGDSETLRLRGLTLTVEQRRAARVLHTRFAVDWLSVGSVGGANALWRLSGEGRSVYVGRHLRSDRRQAFGHELRAALAAARSRQPRHFALHTDPTP